MKEFNILTNQELLSCMELGKALTSELDEDRLYRTILKKLSDLIPAENWSLLLVDQKTGELVFKVCVGIDHNKVKDIRLTPGEGVAGQVLMQQKPMVIEDVVACEYFTDRVDQASGFCTRSITCVPLVFAGKTIGVLEAINPFDQSERAVTLLKLISDYAAIAVENTRRYHRIKDLVDHDNLTGLYNTRYLYKSMKELMEISKEQGTEFCLVFMDIDNFKRVVDTHGHLNGSKAIQEVANTIRQSLEGPEYGVSYAGDEFVIVLPGYSKMEAIMKADEIRTRMRDTVYLTKDGLEINLFASFGVAAFPEDASTMAGLIGFADKAMFAIKDKGKDGVGGGAL